MAVPDFFRNFASEILRESANVPELKVLYIPYRIGKASFFYYVSRKTILFYDMATYLTQEGYDKKMEELAALEAQRPAIKHAIAEARDKGDLSENAEYDAAKEAQGLLEMKIAKLKELVATARIIDDSKLNTDIVQLLNTVTIKNTANGAQMTYTIVTESEANLREHKIASSTPIAQGLLGHKVGDTVQIKAPAGMMNFEIVKIEI